MLVIEADIAPRHRRIELQTGCSHSLDGVHKLVVYFRFIRVAKIQTVGDAQRLSPAAYDVTGRFGHGDHRTLIRVGENIAAIAIRCDGKRLTGTSALSVAQA